MKFRGLWRQPGCSPSLPSGCHMEGETSIMSRNEPEKGRQAKESVLRQEEHRGEAWVDVRESRTVWGRQSRLAWLKHRGWQWPWAGAQILRTLWASQRNGALSQGQWGDGRVLCWVESQDRIHVWETSHKLQGVYWIEGSKTGSRKVTWDTFVYLYILQRSESLKMYSTSKSADRQRM